MGRQIKVKMSKMKPGPAKQRLKQQALRLLKQRRTYENQYNMLQNQSFNMEQQNFAIQSIKDTPSTVAAMKETQKVMSAEFKKLNIDEVEDLQEDMADLMEE